MTESKIMRWIKTNLGPAIDKAIIDARVRFPDHPYTPDWLAGIIMREVKDKINKYVSANTRLEIIHTLMKGDYDQRKGETEMSYHGFGYTQIDIASYPAFIKSGDWKDPYKCVMMAIAVLEEKREYLKGRVKMEPKAFERAITAAYNCGQGNVYKAYGKGLDVDNYTTGHDYSKEVFEHRELFLSLN